MRSILVAIIFLTSAFGAAPVTIRFGSISLSGIITGLICFASILIFLQKPQLFKSDRRAIIPLVLFCLFTSVWFVLKFSPEEQIENYIVVWAGITFILLCTSSMRVIEKNLISWGVLIDVCTIIYIFVMMFEVFTQEASPATAQVGIIFISFHLVKILNNDRRSLFFMAGIICMQILLGARIVVLAEMVIILFGRILLKGFSFPNIRKLTRSGLIIVIMLVGIITLSIKSGIYEKTIGGGDRALRYGRFTVNTSGRIHMWNIVFDSALTSPWIGQGTSGPNEMLRVPRWRHPHNDYLRLFHQLGVVGLFLWISFISHSLVKAWRGSKYHSNMRSRFWCQATFLSIIGISIIMLTDNSMVYSYVVYPMSAMIGITFAVNHNLVVPKRNNKLGFFRRLLA